MTLAMQSNGLNHAVSLGNIEVSAKQNSSSNYYSRSYDSEDENFSRRNLTHTSSIELYPRPSIYSKGDIREQYCLTDRQLNSIDRPRRDRFFGCLSKRSTPQSFLGGCVGRRVPSEENLASYAPFHRNPRYPHQRCRGKDAGGFDSDLETSYFRRQPASILSTPKSGSTNSNQWVQVQTAATADLAAKAKDMSNYQCISHMETGTDPHAMSHESSTTPRTKHVSFARSHTLTSFENVDGSRSSTRIKPAQSQERLIGGKKPGPLYTHPTGTIPKPAYEMPIISLGDPTAAYHLQQFIPIHQPDLNDHILVDRTVSLGSNTTYLSDFSAAGGLSYITYPTYAPPSPEVLVVERKFRSAMKTQATQTDVRKDGFANILALSPRALHKVKVVSQGAQTNGLQNGKKLTKSLSEITSPQSAEQIAPVPHRYLQEHDLVCRTKSADVSRTLVVPPDEYQDINFYEPPESFLMPDSNRVNVDCGTQFVCNFEMDEGSRRQTAHPESHVCFESNSLPRRVCSNQRQESEYYSNSLPRKETTFGHEPCKHLTECSELNMRKASIDITDDLLPPPEEYCMTKDYEKDHDRMKQQKHEEKVRRRSLAPAFEPIADTPFKRDDVRRQSMPVYVKVEKLIDGFGPRSSLRRTRRKPRTEDFTQHNSDEKEILIDFKPHHQSDYPISKLQTPTPKRNSEKSKRKEQLREQTTKAEYANVDDIENLDYCEEALYENIPVCLCKIKPQAQTTQQIMDEYEESCRNMEMVSSPPSPSRAELLANASTYPSSDSLANDNTRDHSDGIWNESQVTVLTVAEQKEVSDAGAVNLNSLLTPSAKRKNLILQHQQRSSIDTDAMDFEEHVLTDLSPSSYSNTLYPEAPKSLSNTQKAAKPTASHSKPPAISVIASTSKDADLPKLTQPTQPSNNKGPATSTDNTKPGSTAFLNAPNSKVDLGKQSFSNNDISECSTNTNTEDYGTCTETSKRTPGIKTSTTTTTSSSVTQIPVSTQSSQMDKTHGGSSFESASSLYSIRGEGLTEDALQNHDKTLLSSENSRQREPQPMPTIPKVSPTLSVSTNSSRSNTPENPKKQPEPMPSVKATATKARSTKPKVKTESVSDEERSEMRYSSSGYYESPQDDEQLMSKLRRNRIEEDRKRRKTSMKLDIEKENIRALTSPIKKPQVTATAPVSEQQVPPTTLPSASPNKHTRRLRTKPRRPMKKQVRSESAPKHQKAVSTASIAGTTTAPTSVIATPLVNQEVLLDCSISAVRPEESLKVPSSDQALHLTSKSTSEDGTAGQPKTKSVESLRSVSPGSDSVFYSEMDAVTSEPHGLCTHCGKEVEGNNSMLSIADNDSVESIPYNKNEENIVRPPSDFADSPITTKTTHRLYKKVDKRFRSEERYHHGERGRLYKTRQENIRAKSEERTRENSTKSPQALRTTGSSPCVLPHGSTEFNQQVIYQGHYDKRRYTRLTDEDVWMQLDHQTLDRNHDRRPSTDSERNFHSKYQVILHRLVQRRCTLEMYQRQKNNTFRVDKTILVKSDSGEFGFRIHGSKPVVVAAIEPDTPAENSGLEVGDIIISVNGIQVLDKHHTEVVKIAHDGCETLELQVARTISVLMSEQQDPPKKPIFCGYLWRQSGQAKGVPNCKKWVRRWFCLRPDNCLYYYKTEDDTKPVGAMILTKHNIEHCPADIGRPFAFKIDSGEGIPLYVAADSESIAEKWMTYLKDCAAHENNWLEKSARNLYQPPSSITRPDCFGYLMKLGSRWCGWSKRYCVLKDACLFFYQDVNSKSAFGMACLHGYKVSSMSSSASGKKNSFELIPPESKLRHYYFCTESEMDKKRWISALEYSIDRWIKSG